MKNYWILFSAVCILITGSVFVKFQTSLPLANHRLGVINLEKLIKDHVRKTALENLNEKERNWESKAFSENLEMVIQELQEKEQITLLVRQAVASPLPDYTEKVADLILKKTSQVKNEHFYE